MIKFGPSGNSVRFYEEGGKSTTDAAKWVADNGLDYFEYSFSRGVNMGEAKALEIKKAFESENVGISVHAPYYINLANPDDVKAQNSFNYILTSAYMCQKMGGNRIIFHPASVGKESREVAVSRTIDRFKILSDLIYESHLENLYFCPETMGKLNQIGTIEEVVEFCKIEDFYLPTIDFGHINAREQGSLKEKADYKIRLEYMLEHLGMEKMKHFHVHFSKIQYTAKGELKHLTFTDDIFGPDFEPLAEALIELDLEPIIICESDGTQADDAIYMKKAYNKILAKRR